MSQHCRCRHNTHSLIDTGGFDWVIRSKLPDRDVNIKSSISIICKDESRTISLICNPSDTSPRSITACRYISLKLEFAPKGNPHSLEHHCECLGIKMFDSVCCPPGLLFSRYFISKPATSPSSICLCIHVKSHFFHSAYMNLVKYSKKSHSMLSSISEKVMKAFQTSKWCYCLTSNLPTIVPVNILGRYATGCPPVYKRLLMERVLRPTFGRSLMFQLWSTLFNCWSHWLVKVGGVKPFAAWKSRKEPESWLHKWQAEI